MISKYIRGMVYWVNLPSNNGEHIQSGRRPCVIISNDLNNTFSDNLTVVPCTTSQNKDETLATHLKTRLIKDVDSIILCEQITTVSKQLLDVFLGVLDTATMQQLDKCIMAALNLTYIEHTLQYSEKVQPQPQPIKQEEPKEKKDNTKKLTTKEERIQFITEYKQFGLKYVTQKYDLISESAARQRVDYYKKVLKMS